MDAKYLPTLRQRKNQVEMTLRYIENERRTVENNPDWLNRAAYNRRVALLEQLLGWYREELGHLDIAIREPERAGEFSVSETRK
jgi:hypothetical protein